MVINFYFFPKMQEFIREFDDYSLSFPCNPHDLRSCAIGFRLLFWADFLLVAGLVLMVVVLSWFSVNSPEFQSFCDGLTPERFEEARNLPFQQRQEFLMKDFPAEQLAPSLGLAGLSIIVGLIINIIGTIFCMDCPVFPGLKTFSLIWFGIFLLNGIPIINILVPLFYLGAWNFWLAFLMRLGILLGENRVPRLVRQVHQSVIFVLFSFLLASLLSWVVVFLFLMFLCLGFFQYAKVLKLLRLKIHQQTQFWDYGSEDFHSKKLA